MVAVEDWITDAEDLETLLRDFLSPLDRHPNFELESSKSLTECITDSVKYAEAFFDRESSVGKFNSSMSLPEYNYKHSIGDGLFYVQFPALNRNLVLWGTLISPLPSRFPEIANADEAEQGSLLHEIRRKHYDIADRNTTEYIRPLFENHVKDSSGIHQPEDILRVSVPPRYDEGGWKQTVDALDDICIEADGLYRDILRTVRNY